MVKTQLKSGYKFWKIYTSVGCIMTVHIFTNRLYLYKKNLIDSLKMQPGNNGCIYKEFPIFLTTNKYFKTYYGAYISQN